MARFEIGIIGTGFSGICAAIQLQKKFKAESTSVTLFEKNPDIGGTWLSNVYPGCACDVASHLYSYSFELNPDWSSNFPPQPEILGYLKRLTQKYQINEHIKFNHDVKTVCWDDKLSKWMVRYVNVAIPNAAEEMRTFDIIINASGPLRIPLVPNAFNAFTGPKMHTAEWNNDIELKDKRVAVIGSGASAVQVIPSIVDNVAALHCYQRKPPFILFRPQFTFSNFMKATFKYLPFTMRLYRWTFFVVHELFHLAFRPGTLIQKFCNKTTTAYRQHVLKQHPQMLDKVTPNYRWGCKRVILSEQYYAAMTHSNVHLHSSHIDKIVNQTIYTKDGSKEEVDVLVLATGFRVSDYFWPMEVIGKDGKNILQSWTNDRPRSFYGVAFTDTPNYFYVYGPNTNLGHSSVIFIIECQVNLITRAIGEMMKRNATVINVKKSSEDKFMDMIDVELKKTVWGTEQCGSWYVNPRGDITTLWPKNSTSYWWQTRNINWSNFEFM